jgi:lambda repressor-like predicted transcriptional regulator
VKSLRDKDGSDLGLEGSQWSFQQVLMHDGRDAEITLKKNGFELVASSLAEDVDFYENNEIITKYYPQCENLLKQALGFDNNSN